MNERINFEEVINQIGTEIDRLSNQHDKLLETHEGLVKDLRTISNICDTYGFDKSQANTYIAVFDNMMRIETELSSVAKKIAEYETLRGDVAGIARRYNKLQQQSVKESCASCTGDIVGIILRDLDTAYDLEFSDVMALVTPILFVE